MFTIFRIYFLRLPSHNHGKRRIYMTKANKWINNTRCQMQIENLVKCEGPLQEIKIKWASKFFFKKKVLTTKYCLSCCNILHGIHKISTSFMQSGIKRSLSLSLSLKKKKLLAYDKLMIMWVLSLIVTKI